MSINKIELRKYLNEKLDVTEIKTIIFDFDIPDGFAKLEKREMILEAMRFLDQRMKLNDLIQYLNINYSYIDWSIIADSNHIDYRNSPVELKNTSSGDKEKTLTGFKDLDRALGGLINSDLILVCGASGIGKSSFVSGIARYVSSHPDKNVVYFSLQDTGEQFVRRIVLQNSISQINADPVNVEDLNLYIVDESDLSIQKIENRLKDLISNQAISLVIIDGFELILSVTNTLNQAENNKEMMRFFKNLAKKFKIPIILTYPISFPTTINKRPNLSVFNEIGNLEMFSDVVLFIFREDFFSAEPYRPNIAEIIIAKNRRGHSYTIDLYWNEEIATFGNLYRQAVSIKPKSP